MKILNYTATASNKYGGLEKFYMNLGCQLEAEGSEIVLIYKRKVSCLPYLEDINSRKIKLYEINSASGYFKFAKAIRKILKMEKPDIIHLNFANSIETIFFYVISRFYGRSPIVTTEHCMPEFVTVRQRLVFALILCLSKKVLGVSNAISQILTTHYPRMNKKIRPLYLGTADFKYDKTLCRDKINIPIDTVAIANIAYHDPVKGLDVLMQAVKHLKYNLGVDNFLIYQIGGAPFLHDEEKLMDELDKLKVSDKFVFMGLRDDVDVILSACDIYCQPSRSEGIPLSIMEAMIAKLPIVATNVGGIPEICIDHENGLLCEKESSIALADNLNMLIQNKKIRDEYGDKGRKLALANFSQTNQVHKLIDIYSSLIY